MGCGFRPPCVDAGCAGCSDCEPATEDACEDCGGLTGDVGPLQEDGLCGKCVAKCNESEGA